MMIIFNIHFTGATTQYLELARVLIKNFHVSFQHTYITLDT